jgi:hypothetical protein
VSSSYIIGWLKRTATVCYIMGVWLIIVLIAVFAIAFQAAYEVVYSGMTLQQAFAPFVIIIIGFSAVSAILSVLFGIGSIKIGQNYGSMALVFVGVIYLLSTITSLILSPWAFTTTNAGIIGDQLVTTSDPTVSLLSSINELISLIGYVGLIIAGFAMKQKTNIGAFTAVSVLAIMGILVGVIIPIAILVLGAAFSQMASKGGVVQLAMGQSEEKDHEPLYTARAPAAEPVQPVEQVVRAKEEQTPELGEGAKILSYCPYCAAKVSTGDLFCAVCGSNLKVRRAR